MKLEKIALLGSLGERLNARILPDVSAVATKLAKLNVIAMRFPAITKHGDELVLRSVKTPHPTVVFHPNTDV
jgi:hypothetical protein